VLFGEGKSFEPIGKDRTQKQKDKVFEKRVVTVNCPGTIEGGKARGRNFRRRKQRLSQDEQLWVKGIRRVLAAEKGPEKIGKKGLHVWVYMEQRKKKGKLLRSAIDLSKLKTKGETV